MSKVKRYSVCVDSVQVYTGPIRTAEIVFSALRDAFELSFKDSDSKPVLTMVIRYDLAPYPLDPF
ncbi:hypothetical protein [Sigmofec virus UA08Rod_5658]|uniref:Uncharacterized protein n=1 Tax=Sigmofec virus UA08Rod_5658 TaxID=2929434 RepID=A0A976R594_9VIRU|nr:hypothetical protein [Sigmofec virus UA08Rod_5658]